MDSGHGKHNNTSEWGWGGENESFPDFRLWLGFAFSLRIVLSKHPLSVNPGKWC